MTTLRTGLRPEQVEQFHRQGFLVVPQVLTEEDLAPLVAELDDRVEALASAALAGGRLSRSYADLPFAQRLGRITAETDEVFRQIHGGWLHGPAVFQVLTTPALLDVVETLVGDEIIASSVYRIRAKVPGSRGEVAPHQDSSFFEPACDESLIVTAWIPLVDATVDNGCLWMWPGLHREGLRRHVPRPEGSGLGIADDLLPQDGAVPVPTRKGDVVLFTNLTPHASFANISEVVRWSMDARYQSAALPTNAPVPPDVRVLVEPADDGPVACYPPEADCLVRSRRHPDAVVSAAEEFHRIREHYVARPVSRSWQSDDGVLVYPPAAGG